MIGQQLGSFLIESKLGSGAMGVVFLAKNLKTGKPAAVKVITAEAGNRSKAQERFEREAEILQQFRHPNIVRFLAVGRYRGTSYFAMEYIQGTTLEHLLERKEFLPWQEVVDLGLQVCEALQYAHERGVVHRDLKPSNLMITETGQLKLADFGIAKDLDATALTATGRTLGTAAYMSPEQIRGTPEVSHKTDLYALGCLFYQMLTGQTPFKGSAIAVLMNCHLNEPPPRPSARNPEIPRVLDDLVLNLMAKAPSDRPWDAQAVATVLADLKDKVVRGEPVKMVFATPSNPTRSGIPVSETGATIDVASRLATKSRKASRGKKKRQWSAPSIETVLLALALVGLLGVLTYLLWPPSAESLMNRARPLIASDKFADWTEAERRYITELERRYHDHPYKNEVEALRDKIALEKSKRRAVVLETSGVPAFREPKTEAESLFVGASTTASEATKNGLEPVALRAWTDLASALSKMPEEHGWYLLANQRAQEVRRVMERRRREASDLLAEAQAAAISGQAELSLGLRRRIIAQYGKYPYLSDILRVASAGLPPSEPEPNSESPDAAPSQTSPPVAEPPKTSRSNTEPPESSSSNVTPVEASHPDATPSTKPDP